MKSTTAFDDQFTPATQTTEPVRHPYIRFGTQRKPFKLQVGDMRLRGGVLQVWCRKLTVNGKLSRTRGKQDYHWVTLGAEESQDQLKKYEEKQA